jgi:hypothetical protein
MPRAILGTRVAGSSALLENYLRHTFNGVFLLLSDQLYLNGEAGSLRNAVFVCWVFVNVE